MVPVPGEHAMVERTRSDVTAAIRAKMVAGALPAEPPTKMWVGKGTGRPCNVCDQPITHHELEYEADLPGDRMLRFHQICLTVWHEERGHRLK
jgi:hypothetical protein